MLELKNIHKRYKMGSNTIYALRGVNLRIEDGDFVAIMGPSGSGKSTMMHIMGLLDIPDEGSYVVNGKEVSAQSEDELATLRRQVIGFVFQQFNLLPRISALENVALPLLYSEGKMDLERARELLERVGLGKRLDHRASEMSGGQQQRVAIARALTNRPTMILADEPTGNLDSVSEKEIMTLLHELNATGITVVIVTHEEEIAKQAKRVIRMRDGAIQSDERLQEFVPASGLRHRLPPIPHPEPSSFRKIVLQIADQFQHFSQGIQTLASNKLRTALSMLGILIGVAAVVAMLALGHGAQKAIEDQLSSLGSNLLVLGAGAVRGAGGAMSEAGSVTRLTPEDEEVLREKIPDITDASANINGRAQVSFLSKNWNTNIVGSGASYCRIHACLPQVGRFFTEEENIRRNRVAIVGATIVREVFDGNNPVGEMMRINKVSFRVIGVIPEKGANSLGDQDDQIIIPLFTAMHRLFGKNYVDFIDIEVNSPENMDAVEKSTMELMFSRHHVPFSQRQDAFKVMNMASVQATLMNSTRVMTLLLSIIATISLLVGGIGIMNIMLVSVTERTREIGLRKAIGAERKNILSQFLIEAVVISLIGGTAGIALAWFVTVMLSFLAGWVASITLSSVLLAFLFSASIGIVFGIYPARKASRLPPIDALRFE